MVEQGPHAGTERDSSDEGESEGIDLEKIREIGGFVLRATRRRAKLAFMTFVTVAAVGITVAATMPRTFSAQVKLLAQRGSAMRMLSGQNTQLDSVDNPTKNVAAMIMRRDNVVALVKDANLVERFQQTRPGPLKLKDHVMALLFGPPSEEDKLLGMVFTLEKRLDVFTDDATVAITVDWSNARIAYDLVTLVQKNFLEARYDSDVAVINDSIAVLEEHAKKELAHVDAELEDYQKVVATRAIRAAVPSPALPPVFGSVAPRVLGGPLPPQPPDPSLTKALEEKRAQIRELEEAQRRTLDTLKQQLVQAQLTLTPMHPTVVALQQRVDATAGPSPELAALRSEERALMAELVAPRPTEPRSDSQTTSARPFRPWPTTDATPVASGSASATAAPPPPPFDRDWDGPLQLAQSKLAAAIRASEDAMARIDAAKVELDITRAAYKYRYTVVTPAELPKKPKKATAELVGVGSVVGGALLAVLLAAALDFGRGSILEPWQVRRRLKLDVLGELDRPS